VRLGYQENRNLKKRNGKTTHLQRSGLSESTPVRARVRRRRSGLLGFQLGRSIGWAVELRPYWLQWTFPELEVLHRCTSGGRPWWPWMKSPPPNATLQARADSWTYQDGKSGWETRLQECHRVAGLNYTTVGSALQQQLVLLAEFALSRFQGNSVKEHLLGFLFFQTLRIRNRRKDLISPEMRSRRGKERSTHLFLLCSGEVSNEIQNLGFCLRKESKWDSFEECVVGPKDSANKFADSAIHFARFFPDRKSVMHFARSRST
jgi:hypothetical protein